MLDLGFNRLGGSLPKGWGTSRSALASLASVVIAGGQREGGRGLGMGRAALGAGHGAGCTAPELVPAPPAAHCRRAVVPPLGVRPCPRMPLGAPPTRVRAGNNFTGEIPPNWGLLQDLHYL